MIVPRVMPRSRRFWAVVGAGVLAAGALQLANPILASAAESVEAVVVTGESGTAARSMTVTCPAETVAVGGLALSLPTIAHIDQIWPATRSVTFHATPLAGYTGTWRLRATALCVAQPAGLQYVNGPSRSVSRTSDDDQRYGAVSFAQCPGDKELIGMGASAIGGRLDLITPEGPGVPYTGGHGDHLYGVSVTGAAYAESPSGSVRAKAVCADPGVGPVVTTNEASLATTAGSLSAACPAGTQLHSVGMHPMYPNHYEDLTAFSYVLPVRLDATTAGLTAGRATMRKHVDSVAVEEWHHVVLSLCA